MKHTSAAKTVLVELALGRVEVLEQDHKFSKEIVEDVKRFSCTPW
jgi:hypothetical protein